MTLDEAVQAKLSELDAMVQGPCPLRMAEVLAQIPGSAPSDNEKVLDALALKAVLVALKKKLDSDPAQNRVFPASTPWALLNQMLTAARLRELAAVKVVKRGGRGKLRYDIGELTLTFYGQQILSGLSFSTRRKIVDKDELKLITDALQRIKLTLPEAVEPTTTEKFFARETRETE